MTKWRNNWPLRAKQMLFCLATTFSFRKTANGIFSLIFFFPISCPKQQCKLKGISNRNKHLSGKKEQHTHIYLQIIQHWVKKVVSKFLFFIFNGKITCSLRNRFYLFIVFVDWLFLHWIDPSEKCVNLISVSFS